MDDPRPLAGTYIYRGNFGGTIRNYGEDDLEACVVTEDVRGSFVNGSFGDRESCRRYLTYLRVSGGLSVKWRARRQVYYDIGIQR